MRLCHTKLWTEFPLVAFMHYACVWRGMWNCAAMAQQAGTQATTQNSQPSWSKGLKHSGLYYEGIVDDCHQVLELHRRSTMSTFGTRTSYRAQSKSFGEDSKENKDSKVTVAILWKSMINMDINLKAYNTVKYYMPLACSIIQAKNLISDTFLCCITNSTLKSK